MSNIEIPPGLIRDFRRGQAALFVGAGASSGAGLPDWNSLVAQLADDLDLPQEPSGGGLSPIQLAAVPQYYENRYGRKSLTEKLRALLPRRGTRPSMIHELLADLPTDLYYTTNFDSLLESAIENRGRDCAVVATEDDAKDHSGREGCQVRKVHGSIDTASSLVITRDDFLRYDARHPHMSERLRIDLATTSFFFVGYSLNDPNFSLLYDRVFLSLAPLERRHYMTVLDANPHQIEDLRRRGLEVIELGEEGEDGSESLANFLGRLCESTSDALHVRRIFKGVEKDDQLPIVLPSYIHPIEKYEYFPRMDLRVSRAVERAMKLVPTSTELYADADVTGSSVDNFLAQDLVLVGSPRGNHLTKYVFDDNWQRFEDRGPSILTRFLDGEERGLVIGQEGSVYRAQDPLTHEGEETRMEYAIISRYVNPWNPQTHIWLFAGLWGLGTQVIGEFFRSGNFGRLSWEGDGDIVNILEISYNPEVVKVSPYRYESVEVVKSLS